MKTLQEYLADLTDLGSRPQGDLRSADFTLDRIESLMGALDHPERKYPTIHVAGTNGKGSVVAFCASALAAQGYKVGTFTSPHWIGALAGIRIDQVQIAEDELEKTFEVLLPYVERRQNWTQFEIVTALAFLHFDRANVDAAVIEVGLGGRLDATSVLRPLVSVITPIDYDHVSILGSTLADIAREKAGIIKPDVPVVIAAQPAEARESILQIAEENNAPVIEIGTAVKYGRIQSDLSGQSFAIQMTLLALGKSWGIEQLEADIRIAMLGRHQIENAVTAFAALQLANERGLRISSKAIQRGLAATRWPGRFEILRSDPVVVLDGAHTPAAAQALRVAVDEYFPGRPVILVIGISVDKNLSGIIEPIRERLTKAIATQSPHSRAMPAGKLAWQMMQMKIEAEVVADAKQAVVQAMNMATHNEVVLVCGSVFLAEYIYDSFAQDLG